MLKKHTTAPPTSQVKSKDPAPVGQEISAAPPLTIDGLKFSTSDETEIIEGLIQAPHLVGMYRAEDFQDPKRRRQFEEIQTARREHLAADVEAEKNDAGTRKAKTWAPDGAFTDVANAATFARDHQGAAIYDHDRDYWLVWHGHTWRPDRDGEITRLAETTARRLLHEAADVADHDLRKTALRLANDVHRRRRLDDMVALARAEPGAFIPYDDRKLWDAAPHLAGAPNGVIDLQPGELRDGVRDDRITRCVGVEYDRAARAPRWLRCLEEVFVNPELVDWFQLAVGYTLTGETGERCFFLCYGEGHNGKSTLFKALRQAFGDYAGNVPLSAFEATHGAGENATPNLAAFDGPRFITASEARVEGGRGVRLNEARIKDVSGDDVITARPLYGHPRTFLPTAKLWLGVNHKPRVGDLSEAFWGRVRLIPFTQKFIGDDVDPDLDATLRDEAPGILAWCVEGARRYYEARAKGHLVIGEAPTAGQLTLEWRQENDPLAEFIDEACLRGARYEVGASDFYAELGKWWRAEGLPEKQLPSARAVGHRLAGMSDVTRGRRPAGIFYTGVGVRTDYEPTNVP